MFKWLNFPSKKLLVFSYDALAIVCALFGSVWLYHNLGNLPQDVLVSFRRMLPYVLVTQLLVYSWFRLYRASWRFVSIADLSRIIKTVFVGATLSAVWVLFDASIKIPRAIFLIYALLLIFMYGGSRLVYRLLNEKRDHSKQFDCQRVLLLGAGQAGEGIARDMCRDVSKKYKPVAFIDDRSSKQGQEIHGIPVMGRTKDIPQVVEKLNIDLIIIAIPSARSGSMRRIVEQCEKANVPFRTLPGLPDLAAGRVSINALRKVMLEDLLGREQVQLDWDKITEEVSGCKALVTGGGGSIGSELCRQIALLNPASLIVAENSEFNLYSLEQELRKKFPHLKMYFYLSDVLDQVAMAHIMNKHRPQLVFHAAAYKHVPMLEDQARIAVKNNILGTRIVAEEAVKAEATKFILISTDKAVNPTNVMGTTKRTAEIFCQNFNARTTTQFITVRFGNVLGSAGSVVPLFKKQLKHGGPLTVTHPDITRYFMTIPEASQLILQATTMGKGGEIFVLDMGEPIKIRYLAEQIIQFAGKRVGEDIEIVYTGLRPGEKLYEELFHESEKLTSTEHTKILKARHRIIDWDMLTEILNELAEACAKYDNAKLITLLKKLVPEYLEQNKIVLNKNLSQQGTTSCHSEEVV